MYMLIKYIIKYLRIKINVLHLQYKLVLTIKKTTTMNYLIDADNGSHYLSPHFNGKEDDFIEMVDCNSCDVSQESHLLNKDGFCPTCLKEIEKEEFEYLMDVIIKTI